MDLSHPRRLYAEAKDAVSGQPNSKKLILLHTGAVLLLSLLITLANTLLDSAIADTGGLSGIGTRSVLSTVQSCLRLLPMLLMPFWEMGYTYVTLKFARKEEAAASDLTVGLQRFFPVLRLQLLQTALYVALAFLASQLGTYLFMLTPWSLPMMAALSAGLQSGSAEMLDSAAMEAMENAALPLALCYGIVFLLLAAPIYYRFRQAQFLLLDDPKGHALVALRGSRRLMRGNALRLFKLDLSFWWFFGLDLAVSAIAYLDMILELAGVDLPFGPTAFYYISMVLYMLCQLALYTWRRNQTGTAYALFYTHLQQDSSVPQQSQPQNNHPWSY